MANYRRTFATLAERAVAQGGVDARAFMTRMVETGVSQERLMQLLAEDLESNGPIFGKFLRSITGAAQATITTAANQGQRIGELVAQGFRGDDTEALDRLNALAEGDGESVLERALDSADPDLAEEIETATADLLEYTWVCTLIKTCHRCLPLHGKTRTLAEWQELGLTPETIHDGWDSSCQCQLVPQKELGTDAREALRSPLVRIREKLETPSGLPGYKKTSRAVSQKDLDRALSARNEALETPEGRRTLRILGSVLDE